MRPVYHCHPSTRGTAPWCANLPCRGHRATRDQLLVAHVLAHRADVPWWTLAPSGREHWIRDAVAALHELRTGQVPA